MGKLTGFLDYAREGAPQRPVAERVNDWFEVYQPTPLPTVQTQAARCMDCGVPFCHTGCPVENRIPDWNDLVYKGRWQEAIRQLHATNNFPEWTGRICPAPCESACVLGINEPAVSIKLVEKNIIERAWEEGWIQPEPPLIRTGKRVAIIGSGPAGLAAAQQLNRAGHHVTVFERNDRLGGLLRYGIPDFKMEKWTIDRRLEQLRAEGIEFVMNAHIGNTHSAEELKAKYDAILLAVGSEQPREVNVPGRHLQGIYPAMVYLEQQNRRIAGETIPEAEAILATGKRVIIIGGGDTGADCLGTAHRHKALSVHQFQINQRPPDERHDSTPWPLYPVMYRSEPAHDEGGERVFAMQTLEFIGDAHGNVKQLRGVQVTPKPEYKPVPGSEFTMEADLVLLAIGYTGPTRHGLLEQMGVELSHRGNIRVDKDYRTSLKGVYAAGDSSRGQSLVVWAIADGRKAAATIDRDLR
jgi:glutamate synthase (NADPH) small chain